jgi:hypothetical protein
LNGRLKRLGNGNYGPLWISLLESIFKKEIGVRLDFHHFHADASLGDVPVLSSSGAVALRSKNENRV